MSGRKPWSQEEDALLKELYEQSEVKKWPKIAQKMSEVHHMPTRTGK